MLIGLLVGPPRHVEDLGPAHCVWPGDVPLCQFYHEGHREALGWRQVQADAAARRCGATLGIATAFAIKFIQSEFYFK